MSVFKPQKVNKLNKNPQIQYLFYNLKNPRKLLTIIIIVVNVSTTYVLQSEIKPESAYKTQVAISL